MVRVSIAFAQPKLELKSTLHFCDSANHRSGLKELNARNNRCKQHLPQ